jgi:hypothetical protein
MPLESHFIQRSSDAWLHQAVSRRGPRFDKCKRVVFPSGV